MLSHYDNDPTQERVIPRRSSARRRDPLSQKGDTFRPDLSDAQTFAFAKLTNCLIFEEFPDTSPCDRISEENNSAKRKRTFCLCLPPTRAHGNRARQRSYSLPFVGYPPHVYGGLYDNAAMPPALIVLFLLTGSSSSPRVLTIR
jgi:hypothetical protein